MDKNNLKTLKELILDEQKIMTYISVSKELCVHINEAKSLMKQIVQYIRNSEAKSDIYVCFTISGILNDNSAYTTVCSESNLDSVKKTFKTIFYEHVYCVSRGLQDVNVVALSAINKFEDLTLCNGLIKANSCTRRPDDELVNLKSNATIDTKSNTVASKVKSEKPKETKSHHDNGKKVIEVKSEPVYKAKTPSPKKDKSANINKTNVKNGVKPAGKSIAGFFSKTNGVSNSVKPTITKIKDEKKDDTSSEDKEVKGSKISLASDSDIIEPSKVESSNKSQSKNSNKNVAIKEESSNNKTKKNTSNNSLSQIKRNAKVDKKRKRVLLVSDSESEKEENDPFEDDNKMTVDPDSEDEIPPTPLANTVKITSGIVNPKKRRKIVDKTYTDEDGYILTKKEEVYESCSDNEVETKDTIKVEKENIELVTKIKTETSPKENGKTKKKKVSPPQKGKQQTMMNFFKKL